MLEFNRNEFIRQLRLAPPVESIFEPFEHSEYLQKKVFDPLREGKSVPLAEIDFDAFEMRHVIPMNQDKLCLHTANGWAMGLNRFIKKSPAVASGADRRFF